MTGRDGVYQRIAGWVVVSALLVGTEAAGQIVNTLGGFDPAARGFEGAAGVRVEAEGGNTDVFESKLDAELRFLTEDQTFRALGGYAFKRADGVDRSDDSFVHLRHNHRVVGRLHSLLFAQWSRNPFQDLRRRVLLGAGARFDALVGEAGHLTLGAANMFEEESLRAGEGSETWRLSTYLDAAWTFPSGVRLAANTFVQPRWAELSDLRAIGTLGVLAPLGGGFALAVTASVTYDAEPPDGVEETDWELGSGLNFRF